MEMKALGDVVYCVDKSKSFLSIDRRLIEEIRIRQDGIYYYTDRCDTNKKIVPSSKELVKHENVTSSKEDVLEEFRKVFYEEEK